MTAEQLEDFITRGDLAGLTQAVTGFSESERKKLSKTASLLLNRIQKAIAATFTTDPFYNAPGDDALTTIAKRRDEREVLGKQQEVAKLAAVAFCPLSVVKRLEFSTYKDKVTPLVISVISDRKPDWTGEWVELELRRESTCLKWDYIETLIRAGACPRPTTDAYIRFVVAKFPDNFYSKEEPFVPLSRKLRGNSFLLETEVWRLFEVETRAFTSDWYLGRKDTPDDYESWTMALVRLTNEKVIDRQRLIDGCFLGLTSGFTNKNTLTGYIQFYEALEPTTEEVIQRQNKFLDLLAHSAEHVVSFALKQIQRIDKEHKLDDEAFLRPAETLVLSRIQGQVKTTLTILSRIIKRQERLRKAALGILVQGIGHESAAVREMTLRLVGPWLNDEYPEIVRTLRDSLDRVSPSVREKVQSILAHFGCKPKGAGASAEPKVKSGRIEELKQQARLLPERIRKLAGVDSVLKAIEEGGDYAPLDYDLYDAQVLSGVKPIQPIQSLEELIESVSHAIEVVDSAEEVERILDGISRFGTERPEDFERQTGPIKKRIMVDHGGGSAKALLFGSTPPHLSTLLLSWLGEKPKRQDPPYYVNYPSPTFVMNTRCYELAVRIHHGISAPLLAMPTHRHGWIDPRVFVERMIYYQANQLMILKQDFTQALLRLAPDYRSQAFKQAGFLNGMPGDIVRWVLGASIPPSKPSKQDVSLWITAGRVRDLRRRLNEFEMFTDYLVCADAIIPAQYEWKAFKQTCICKWNKTEYQIPFVSIVNGIDPEKMRSTIDVPSSMMHIHGRDAKWESIYYGYHANIHWLVHWCGMIWPQNADAFCVAGIEEMIRRIDMVSSVDDPNFAYYELLFEPDRPLLEMAILLIWMGLAGKDADARGHAIDLLTEAIHDGRAHPQPFGEVLVKLCAGGWVKLNRIGDALNSISRVSPLHAYVCCGILRRWLAGQETLPDDAHHLLSLQLELSVQIGWTLSETEKRPLAGVSGSSKTAKLAKDLIRCEFSRPSAEHRQALIQQLEARLRRGQRWQVALAGK
ncbi:MAG: hypothetical protein GX455_06040 [Phycisphaerae bacterium]|nr:hypothetical protein [Phycisphaerae bacterium]